MYFTVMLHFWHQYHYFTR